MIKDTNSFSSTKQSQSVELSKRIEAIDKDRFFKGKIQQRILGKLLAERPLSIHHIRDMRSLSVKHRVDIYMSKQYKECLHFFKRWENLFEVSAHTFSQRALQISKFLLEYHRILLFEGASFTEKDAENINAFLKEVFMHVTSTRPKKG